MRILTQLLLVVFATNVGSTSFADAPRPNILYIYLDDFGWGGLGPNGQFELRESGQAHLITPNMDRLAAEGVNFQRAYGCTVCSPARASQQTSFHQGHAYSDRNNRDNARKAMRAEDVTMGDVLSSAGYRTGFWGKWGFGASSDQVAPVLQNLQTLPNNHGYQYVLAELHHVRAHTFFQPTLWKFAPGDSQIALAPNSLAAYQNNRDYPNEPALQNDPSYPAIAYCDDSYAFAALDFVRHQGEDYNATGQPFFALFSVQIPHTPYGDITSLPDWDAAYAGTDFFSGLSNNAKQYAAMVSRIDAHIGNLLDALEDPNHDGDTSDSIAANTIVVFQSDNGGQNDLMNQNAFLRGHKNKIWEGGIRVPMLLRWPDQINATTALKPGTNSQKVIDVTDLLPTFCELAGQELPLGIDGVSFAPTLTGNGEQIVRDFIIHEAGNHASIIRGKWKLVRPGSRSYELYDLEADPTESNDLAGVSEHAELVGELSDLLLGERVTEPAWFAPTYHHWTGGDGASTSDAADWSDYTYSDLGGVYQTDTGAPQLSWIARMTNQGSADNTAVADADLEFLALEISGDTASQTLELANHRLIGRNGIRVHNHGVIDFDNGTIATLRRIELNGSGRITGSGTVEGTLINSGTLELTQSSDLSHAGPSVEVPGPDITLTDGMELVSNGGFELGTSSGGGDSYATLKDWFTDGPDDRLDATKTNKAKSGKMRGLFQTGYSLVEKTGYPVRMGDHYTLSFWHRGFSGWSTGEMAEVRVFYINSDGDRVDLLRDTFPMTNGTWVKASYQVPPVADAAANGRALHVLFGPDSGTGFGSIDDVSMVRHGAEITVPGSFISQPGPDIATPGHSRFEVIGDYSETQDAVLRLSLAGTTAGQEHGQVKVSGEASLAGTLEVTVDPGFQPQANQVFTILTAANVEGSFANENHVVVGSDGTRFLIKASANEVTLTVIGADSQGTP